MSGNEKLGRARQVNGINNQARCQCQDHDRKGKALHGSYHQHVVASVEMSFKWWRRRD